MRFLRRLSRISIALYPSRTRRIEPLARYLLNKRHFSRENNRVKSGAFLPPDDLRLSVFETSGLSDSAIWEIGETRVAKPRGKPLLGRPDTKKSLVDALELAVDIDDKPYRHGNIVGWPADKDKQKMLALELADQSTLCLTPSN
jgi:hypothetical protein